MLSDCYCGFFRGEWPLAVVTEPITSPGESADKAWRSCTEGGDKKAAAPVCPPATLAIVTHTVGRTDGGVRQTAEMKLINKSRVTELFHLVAPQKGGKPWGWAGRREQWRWWRWGGFWGHIIHFSFPGGAIICALILHAHAQEPVNEWPPHLDDTPFVSACEN